MSEGGNLWYLNNSTNTRQLATKSEIMTKVSSDSGNQYQVIISSDYANNQCVKYSDIKIIKVTLSSVSFNCSLVRSGTGKNGILTISDCNPSNMNWSIVSSGPGKVSITPASGYGNNSSIKVTPYSTTGGLLGIKAKCDVTGSLSEYESLTKSTGTITIDF